MKETMDTIRLDRAGIAIGGKYRTLLVSSLFYFRIPRERWEERMKLLKAAGYHAIDVYFPWNYHETAPEQWDFSGNRDVEEFLRLAAENGLFVIARPGPYICSEWDGGAIPAWLWEKEIAVRQDDARFLEEMEKWYRHILPLLAKYQIGRQGTILCMQIENELDFYRCVSPVSYMEKLKGMAEREGITVPLFYCCGQNDLLRGGGLTPGLYTAFNVYSDGDNAYLEERAEHLYRSVQEREMPFLVTETNREHGYLKRLLACGARLLSPYNQTAGSTMDFYNGITNWGTPEQPIALMASDYDFCSMIGSAGEVNEQFLEARLLSGLIYSLGEELATAEPGFPQTVAIQAKGKVNSRIPVLQMERGRLIEISNLGEAQRVAVQAEEIVFDAEMKALETKLLPWHFRISADCEIVCSNYEIGWIARKNDRTEVCLYGQGRLDCLLRGAWGEQRLEGRPDAGEKQFSYGEVDFWVTDAEKATLGHVPGLPDLLSAPGMQERAGEAPTLLAAEAQMKPQWQRAARISPMESMGQYRGIGGYLTELSEDGEYLLTDAADILTMKNGGRTETVYANGGCLRRYFHRGALQLESEIWGHSNFDDVRCRSLQMGSLKGISGLIRLEREEDISESWYGDLDENPWGETCFFRHSPYNTIMGIDSYNRAASPLKVIYSRFIQSDVGEDALFLHFEKADCIIGVYVNNRYAGMVQKLTPYLDLSRFAGSGRIELTLRTVRRYYTDSVGRVTLLGGRRIPDCTYGALEPEAVGKFSRAELPVRLAEGENKILQLSLQPGGRDVKLFFSGRNIKLTVYAGSHAAGRILLAEENMPVVAGGPKNVVHLCGEWCGDVRIWCQAVGKESALTDICVKEYTPMV